MQEACSSNESGSVNGPTGGAASVSIACGRCQVIVAQPPGKGSFGTHDRLVVAAPHALY